MRKFTKLVIVFAVVSALVVAAITSGPCDGSLHTIFGGIFDTTGCFNEFGQPQHSGTAAWLAWSEREQNLLAGSILGAIGLLLIAAAFVYKNGRNR